MSDFDIVMDAIEEAVDFLFDQEDLVISVVYLHQTSTSYDGQKTKPTYERITMDAVKISTATNKAAVAMMPFSTKRADLILRTEDCPENMTPRDKLEVDGRVHTISPLSTLFGAGYAVVLEGQG